MSVLNEVLQEEYERSLRIKSSIEKELKTLPDGYISHKIIKNKRYCYIQKRIGGKVVSTYLPADKVNAMKSQIEKRKTLEASLKEVNENIKKLKRVIK